MYMIKFWHNIKPPEKHRLDPNICTWICPVLESRNILAVLLGGKFKVGHNKRLLAERCLIAAAVQLGGWQAYIGHLWCLLCSELWEHHYSYQKWEISLDCIKGAKNSCILLKWIQQALFFFCCSCVPEKLSMNQKDINKEWYLHKK